MMAESPYVLVLPRPRHSATMPTIHLLLVDSREF